MFNDWKNDDSNKTILPHCLKCNRMIPANEKPFETNKCKMCNQIIYYTYLTTPNNWQGKAGVHIKNGKLILPFNKILIPMNVASLAVMNYNQTENLSERLYHIIIICISVRNADTYLFKEYYKMFKNSGRLPDKYFCSNCFRTGFYNTKMTEYRKITNDIIHHFEKDSTIPTEKFNDVINYYDEIFKLQLVPDNEDGFIHFPASRMDRCKKCMDDFKNNYTHR